MQVLVVGAGVIGLAAGRQAALAGHDVIIAEAATGIGTGISSRNSEVIHAGMYYPTGSLKARHCVLGRRMLYAFCRSLTCVGALNSPETGIIDSHGTMLAMQGDLEDRGGNIAFNTVARAMRRRQGQWHVMFERMEETLEIVAVS